MPSPNDGSSRSSGSARSGSAARSGGAASSAAGAPKAARSAKTPKNDPTRVVRPVDPSLAEVKFLPVAEVATVMRVSKMPVYRMVHSGELPAVRVGRSFRVPEQAVHDYLRGAFIEAG